MRALLFCFWLGIILASPAPADFKAGLDAYDRGDFGGAYREWLPVAQRGDANAEFNVGLLFAAGKGVPKDAAKAVEWYRKAATQGVGAAEYNLGVMYANGEGVTRDVHEAVKWLQKAADDGIPMGREELADLYGGTVVQDYEKSLAWHKQAATAGDPVAQFDLALMYDLGHGVPRSYEDAMAWYRKAADQGYAPAMTNIGILYYNQEGVNRDLVQAYAWFVRAKLAHDPRADDLLQMTMDKLKGDQVRQGEALAANWHPQKPSAAVAQADMAALDAKLFKQPGARTISQTQSASNPPASAAETDGHGDASRESPQETVISGVQRVIAIGDVGDRAETFQGTLQAAGILDAGGNWTGGTSHLVVSTGRVDGRLADVLTQLQSQAERAGGGVHILVGPTAMLKINETLYAYDAWYRSEADLDEILREHGARRIVTSHADSETVIAPQFHGKLIVNADAPRFGCLVIEYGRPFALYRGQGLALPADEGPDLQRYRRQVSAAAMQ